MYVNLASGECGWEPPLGAPVRQADGNQWWELFDPQSGRFYYYNSVGRRTVWHRPQGGDIVPLSQLQAMKRSKEAKRAGVPPPDRQPPQQQQQQQQQQHGSMGSTGSQGHRAPLGELPRDGPPPGAPESSERDREEQDAELAAAAAAAAAESRSQGDGSSSTEYSADGKEPQRYEPRRVCVSVFSLCVYVRCPAYRGI